MNWMKTKPTSDTPQPPARATSAAAGRIPTGGQANIGSSMQVKGELTGSEDMTVDGRVEGKIFLNNHRLTVGRNGLIKADILDAGSVIVHGEIQGNITATDRVEVADSGTMQGDIRAPRVVLADGARFKGQIDMEPTSVGQAEPAKVQREA